MIDTCYFCTWSLNGGMTIVGILSNASNIPLDTWAHIAEIVIALGTLVGIGVSMWFSRESLRRADWNSNMAAAPSITLNCQETHLYRNPLPEDGGIWGEPTYYLEPSEDYITLVIKFLVLNQGRGVALGIRQPKVSCAATTTTKDVRIPVSLAATRDESDGVFEINVRERHSKWQQLLATPLSITIKMNYTNDQGNVDCVSVWNAELKPFEVEGNRLKVRAGYNQRKIVQGYMQVDYSPKSTHPYEPPILSETEH